MTTTTMTKEQNLHELLTIGELASETAQRDGWDRARLLAHQDRELRSLLSYAVEHSPFYRDHYRGIDVSGAALTSLPPVDKATLMEHFDDVVTDRRVTRQAVEQHASEISGDALLDDEFRVMTTGGTTGVQGWFVYGRDDWRRLLGTILPRCMAWWQMPPPQSGAPAATVYASSPLHMSRRLSASLDSGLSPRLALPSTAPLPELVHALNEFQPASLMLYPSIGALLAVAQLDGRLRIHPSVVISSSEQLTPEMRDRMEQAWSVRVFNTYSTTETGPVGSECEEHSGIHVFEDMAIIEVVDADGCAVPAGSPGSKVLVTNLLNRTQPIIRYEISDLLTMSPEPCGCGRAFAVIADVEGRSDDVLHLPGRSGLVTVHPKVIRDTVGGFASVLQYQVVRHRDRIATSLVLHGSVDAAVVGQAVASALRARFETLGVRGVEIDVCVVPVIDRAADGGGKFKLVRNLAD